jgi:hypothetical protein
MPYFLATVMTSYSPVLRVVSHSSRISSDVLIDDVASYIILEISNRNRIGLDLIILWYYDIIRKRGGVSDKAFSPQWFNRRMDQ